MKTSSFLVSYQVFGYWLYPPPPSFRCRALSFWGGGVVRTKGNPHHVIYGKQIIFLQLKLHNSLGALGKSSLITQCCSSKWGKVSNSLTYATNRYRGGCETVVFSADTSKRFFFFFYYSLESYLSKVCCKLLLIPLMHSEKFQSSLLILLICDCFTLSVQSPKSDFIQQYISSERCVLFRMPKTNLFCTIFNSVSFLKLYLCSSWLFD